MRTPISFRISRVALCVALALGAVPVLAQNTTSAVAGKVTARDGKSVANATVTIRHVETGVVTTVTTDAEGRYVQRGLRTGGPYTITASKDGVTESKDGVFLVLAETNAVDVQLPKREVITVTAGTLLADKFSPTAMGATTQIGKAEIESLPSIGRNLQDLARTDPRVAQTDKERGEISV
ncbi:MAG: carboxypeptidase-like regulatory domain-containing protein, partial [Gemmatimonadales bacterium]